MRGEFYEAHGLKFKSNVGGFWGAEGQKGGKDPFRPSALLPFRPSHGNSVKLNDNYVNIKRDS